jgi:fatty acid kinase/fatty acid kinase fatty acid binding subunit
MPLHLASPVQIGYLDGPRLRRTLVAACEYAQTQRTELNRINVFPVPDGDTGTNLALTVRAIADHLRGNRDQAVAAVAQEAASAAVLGARGNCGMMLSHFLLGFAADLRDRVRIGTQEFAGALRAGVRNLCEALDSPVEGTILTVMRDTAEAASPGQGDFATLLQQLVERARASLARTPELLPVLRSAGVVDAGAKGFVSLLEGVLLFIHGDPLLTDSKAASDTAGPADEEDAAAARVEFPDTPERFRFCTEALVRGDALPTQLDVRARLREHGDSLIVIRSGSVLKIHVHTDHPEAVFTYLRGVGRLVTHKAEDMHAQHDAVEHAADQHIRLARRPVVIMTDSASDLPEEVIRAHGIQVTPLLLMDADRTYRDGIDITAEEFHRRLTSDASLPTTSQPAPADFMETFARAAEDGEAVVGVILGSALSGTFRSAAAAAARFHGAPVRVVDSAAASLLQGLLVMRACELAELGRSPEDIVADVAETRRRSGLLFTVDTFDRLLASGRVGRGRALLGSVLGVKPVLEVTVEGTVAPVGKAVGMMRARTLLLDTLARRIPRGARVRFGVVHAGDPATVEPVSDELRARYGGDVEILASPVTPVLATHIGSGAWGVAYLVEKD